MVFKTDTKIETNFAKLLQNFNETRSITIELFKDIDEKFANKQTMPDVSPAKWHLAHTTWFFEQLLLKEFVKNYQEYDENFNFLFNSYYNSFGNRLARNHRNLIDKSTKVICQYREAINEKINQIFAKHFQDISTSRLNEFLQILRLGINHEQQHQELLLTDIKHVLFMHADKLIYSKSTKEVLDRNCINKKNEGSWIYNPEGLVDIGFQADNDSAFAYDNETPVHKFYLVPYLIFSQLVTNAEYLEFIEAKGYSQIQYWLDDGWNYIKQEEISAPLYWSKQNNKWRIFTLGGWQDLNPIEPVSHISFYEAEAFARWKNLRLPSEQEWEAFAQRYNAKGHFQENKIFHPLAQKQSETNVCEGLWQFTASPYIPYPGYKQPKQALGEYNAKFMINQTVLRGGSCATPMTHYRHSYRNFFYPHQRWQFTGFRLAQDAI